MLPSIIICSITCVAMVCSILFFPKIKLGKVQIDTYLVITAVGAITVLFVSGVNVSNVGKQIIADSAVNPIKILILFLSMTILSIFLDEVGFFRYLAVVVIKKAKTGQTKLFLILYFTVAVLTVFTSNDIIILSFTPFICYFAKNAKINPIPYLAGEFVAANTWSMLLIIGNPTNIYLATSMNIDFLQYVKLSVLPTVFGGIVSVVALLLLFKNQLSKPMTECETQNERVDDKLSFIVGVTLLGVCTVLLAVSSYVGIEMWIVALSAVCVLILYTVIISIVRKKPLKAFYKSVKRVPYQLVPFVLSMFVMIAVLSETGVTEAICRLLGNDNQIIKYGVFSFLASNLINNIPMSVLFSSVLSFCETANIGAIMATVVGSNIGAFFTPVGALAGIMWNSIIAERGVKFGYVDFLKIGVVVAIPTLLAAIGGVYLSVL